MQIVSTLHEKFFKMLSAEMSLRPKHLSVPLLGGYLVFPVILNTIYTQVLGQSGLGKQ